MVGRSGPFSRWSKAKAALDKRAAVANGSLLAPWTLHDIRRTVATRLADLGVLRHVIEAILNHVSGHKAGVAGIYNRSTYAAETREALTKWVNCVQQLIED
jgi:integrase